MLWLAIIKEKKNKTLLGRIIRIFSWGLPQGRGLGLQGWPGRSRGWVGLRKAGGSGDDGGGGGGGDDERASGKDPQGHGMGEGSVVEE